MTMKIIPKTPACDPVKTETTKAGDCGCEETVVACKGNDPVFPEDIECGPVPEAGPCGDLGSYHDSLGVDLQCDIDDARREGYHTTGLRPYRVFLVWRKRQRDQPPDRAFKVIKRVELVPVNLVALDTTDLELTSVGLDAIGGVSLTQISPGQVSDDDLRGKLDGRDLNGSEEEFFYEIVHRTFPGQSTPPRRRYILAGEPHHDGEGFQYVVNLRTQAADLGPNGEDQNLPPVHPRRRPELVS
jgi:hypothetical protein